MHVQASALLIFSSTLVMGRVDGFVLRTPSSRSRSRESSSTPYPPGFEPRQILDLRTRSTTADGRPRGFTEVRGHLAHAKQIEVRQVTGAGRGVLLDKLRAPSGKGYLLGPTELRGRRDRRRPPRLGPTDAEAGRRRTGAEGHSVGALALQYISPPFLFEELRDVLNGVGRVISSSSWLRWCRHRQRRPERLDAGRELLTRSPPGWPAIGRPSAATLATTPENGRNLRRCASSICAPTSRTSDPAGAGWQCRTRCREHPARARHRRRGPGTQRHASYETVRRGRQQAARRARGCCRPGWSPGQRPTQGRPCLPGLRRRSASATALDAALRAHGSG